MVNMARSVYELNSGAFAGTDTPEFFSFVVDGIRACFGTRNDTVASEEKTTQNASVAMQWLLPDWRHKRNYLVLEMLEDSFRV